MRALGLFAASMLIACPIPALACDLDGYGGHRFFAFANMLAQRQQEQQQQQQDRRAQADAVRAQPDDEDREDSVATNTGSDDTLVQTDDRSVPTDEAGISWAPSEGDDGRVDPSAMFR